MFNIKLLNYAGSFQLRVYEIPIEEGSKIDDSDIDTDIFFEGSEKEKIKDNDSSDRSIRVSFNRSKQKIIEYARANVWTYFATFTFADSDKYNRLNYDDCFKLLNNWLNNLKKIDSNIGYLAVPEQHKKGGWHFHVLFTGGSADTFRLEKASNFEKKGSKQFHVYNCNLWKNGFSTFTEVQDTKRVSAYISKYITKSLVAETKGKHRYMASRNLRTAEVTTFYLDADELEDYRIKLICDSSKSENAYSKTEQRGASNITYVDFNKSEFDMEKIFEEIERMSICTGYGKEN